MKKTFALAIVVALLAMGGLSAAEMESGSDMVWGLMVQLGHNMWGEEPLVGSPVTEEEKDKYARDFNRTDEGLWREVTDYAAKKGVNLLLIDLGEGIIYPSHPELAVKGSWSPEKMKSELARLRALGLEPIPKLNFSASHDAWLKQYSRMISTPEYYKVCADLIRDVCEIFGKPRLFHLGWDEEKLVAQGNSRLAVVRQGDLWWHDFLFTANEVEKNGSQAWLWSDVIWKHKKEFLEKMPHRVMQSNWHYFFLQNMVRNDTEINKRPWPEAWAGPLGFLELEEAKYDQIPCASNYKVPKNLEIIVKFAKEHIARERIKGFLMAPWARTYGEKGRAKLIEACDLIEHARKVWADDEKDIVIYGANPVGVAAAVQARKKGLEPILVEPSSGVVASQVEKKSLDFKIRDYAITFYCNERLNCASNGIELKDGRITAISTERGKRLTAKMFLDCSYDGELAAAAGKNYVVGRKEMEFIRLAVEEVLSLEPGLKVQGILNRTKGR